MNREIKKRVYNTLSGIMSYGTEYDRQSVAKLPEDLVKVMYSTGFTDMKGNDIFESDVLAVHFLDDDNKDAYDKAEVIWKDGSWAIKDINGVNPGTEQYFHEAWNDISKISSREIGVEVLGNIYQNPDLLK